MTNSKPYYSDNLVTLWHGDCVEVMRQLPEASVDAVVTDPPYGLEFMGKQWDRLDGTKWRNESEADKRWASQQLGERSINARRRNAPDYGKPDAEMQLWHQAWAVEALRILKPGGHLLAFGGTRTWHRLAVAIEDAGFEVRDSIAWMYGSGFPKSLDVSKAIDKAAGAEREVVGARKQRANGADPLVPMNASAGDVELITAPATPAAQQWQGWGTALKPAFEPIVVARKPLIGTVAENVLTHGTGALNIDGCRIGTDSITSSGQTGMNARRFAHGARPADYGKGHAQPSEHQGRWPANVILDESQAAELDRQADELPARFFYVPKANSSERPRAGDVAHPTVKPLELMRYLVKLVTPPGGTVLEPFAGSGTTLEACVVEGFNVIGIELTEDYLPLITQRISKPIEQVLL